MLAPINNAIAGVGGFIGTIVSIGDYLILAVVIAAIGWICARLFVNTVMSLLLACGIAAGVMGWSIAGDWISANNQSKIVELQKQLRFERAKRAEIEATNEVLYESLVEESQAAGSNAEVMARLQDQLEELQDRPECVAPGEFTDELKKLR